jgi:N-acetylmuramoyl-L-alanine amidase
MVVRDRAMRERASANPLYFVYLAVAAAALLAIYFWFSPAGDQGTTEGGSGRLAVLPPKSIPTAGPTLRSPQGPGRLRIGIVAGHAGRENDPGAVCPDGLTEVSINKAVAELVVSQLAADGIATDLMDEFDDRQEGYVATALVSIHTDACIYPEASGFKVASLEGSTNPLNPVLVDCLITKYGERTGLPFHAGSITYDMTQYHVFNSIAPQTPGAIIEVGFMLADRAILTDRTDVVAQGIVDGLYCFLEAQRAESLR